MSIRTALCFFLFLASGLAQQPGPARVIEYLPEPSVSADKTAVVLITSNMEVWIRNIDGSGERKVFTCSSRCRNPQFSPDRRAVFLVVDVSENSGGVWKIDLSTETAVEFIRDSARFRVIQQGPYPGFIIADQRTLTYSDGSAAPYPYYAFFIFRPTGTKVGRVGEEEANLDALLTEYSQ